MTPLEQRLLECFRGIDACTTIQGVEGALEEYARELEAAGQWYEAMLLANVADSLYDVWTTQVEEGDPL